MDFNLLKIKEYKLWSLYLHESQSYLSHVYLLASRKTAIDFLDINEHEKEEFFYLAKKVKLVLKILFNSTMMNYASLGNRFTRLHVHFIPRYQDERIFYGHSFIDNRWGMNYAPYKKDFVVPELCLFKRKDRIKECVDKI